MRSEDTTERMNGRTVVWGMSTAIVGDVYVYVYTVVAENWTWQGGIRAE